MRVVQDQLDCMLKELKDNGWSPLQWLYQVGDSASTNVKMAKLAATYKANLAKQLVEQPGSGFSRYACNMY